MKSAEVAKAMNMALRSYEHFEAGGGRLNLDRVHRFAEVTRSDPHAILAAVAFGSPAFALRCADNKLMTILMIAANDFDRNAGDAIPNLAGLSIINAFTEVFRELGTHGRQESAVASEWLEEGVRKLASSSDEDPSTP